MNSAAPNGLGLLRLFPTSSLGVENSDFSEVEILPQMPFDWF